MSINFKVFFTFLFFANVLTTFGQTRDDVNMLLDSAKSVYKSDKQQAYQFEKRALAISEEINYDFGLVKSNYYLGFFYTSIGDSEIKNTILHYLDATRYSAESDSLAQSWGIKAHMNLGNIFHNYGAYNLAIAEFEKGIELSREIGESNQTLRILYNQQRTLRDGEFYEEAITVLHEILSLTERGSKEHYQALNGLGILYRYVEDYSNALKYLQELLANYQSSPDSKFLRYTGQAYISTGKVKVQQEQLEEARAYFEKAVEIGKQVNDENTRFLFNSLQSLGDVYVQLDQPEQALTVLSEAETLIPGLRNKRDFFHVFNTIANQNELLGYKEESLNYKIKYQEELTKYIELQEKIRSTSMQFSMQMIVASYYQGLESQQQAKQSRTMFLAIIIALSTVLILFVGYYLISRYYLGRMLDESLERLEWVD